MAFLYRLWWSTLCLGGKNSSCSRSRLRRSAWWILIIGRWPVLEGETPHIFIRAFVATLAWVVTFLSNLLYTQQLVQMNLLFSHVWTGQVRSFTSITVPFTWQCHWWAPLPLWSPWLWIWSFFLGPWSFVWDLVLELLVDVVVGDLQDGEEVLVDPGIICSLVGTLQGLRYSQWKKLKSMANTFTSSKTSL